MEATIDGSVLVGVDGSDGALRAVRWAADEAARRRKPLRLVNAFGWTDEVAVGYPGLRVQYRDVLLEQSRSALAAAAALAADRQPELDVSSELRVGFPIGILAEEARRAALLVVGDRGLNRVEGLLLGSVAAALAAHAACPVVVVRGAQPGGSAPVVVGVDDSRLSEAAIGFAFQAAADRSAPLTAVHTWWDTFLDPGLTTQLLPEEEQARGDEVLSEQLAGWSKKYPQVQIERIVAHDRPAHLLLKQSQRAQLAVVGSRGHGELAGLVLGSVSNALLHKAACPVAVVRCDTSSG